MTLNFAFSLQETNQNIFLHAIDGQFDNSMNLEKNFEFSKDNIDEFNVKFLLSLDGEENFNDISTEINSEGEESVRDSCSDIKMEVYEADSSKIKVTNFLNGNYLNMKTELEKIRTETVTGLRSHQAQIYNKMMAMQQIMRSSQVTSNFGSTFNA